MIVIKNQVVYAVVIATCFLYVYGSVLDKSHCYDLSPDFVGPLHAVSPEYVVLRVGVSMTLFAVDSARVLALRSSIRLNTCCATRCVVCMAISDCVGRGVRTYIIS